jgi:uncharacterized damage-inducible protein DinB
MSNSFVHCLAETFLQVNDQAHWSDVIKIGRIIMTSNEKLVGQMDTARATLLGAIEGLDKDTLSNDIVSGVWTVKDVLGHLVSWGDEFRQEIQTILFKNSAYDYTIRSDDHFNEWNLAEAEKKKSMSWQMALEDFERDYKETNTLISSLSEAQLRTKGPVLFYDAKPMKIESIIKIHPNHIKHHQNIIKKWRKKL